MHILLTRQLEDSKNLIQKFKSNGFKVSNLPLLEISKSDYNETKIYNHNAIIFTSSNAIRFLDLKNITDKDFTTSKFVDYCACDGKVKLEGKYYTVLLAPMEGFYVKQKFGKTQVRLAMVESEKRMMITPIILKKLLLEYLK